MIYNLEIGIDSFASVDISQRKKSKSSSLIAISELLERIQCADKNGLNIFGIGEHHREEFLDSAPHMILSSAASMTKNIKLSSAVTVLSAADPVRVFQNYATLDLISKGRAEIVAGRGSFSESFPLFGLNFQDYDDLFSEKLELLLQIRQNEVVNWSGKFRPKLLNQSIYPRPFQNTLPIWLGVGGTPESFIRAGKLGLPLMVAIIGGQTHRFRPLIDLYRKTGLEAGFNLDQLKVGVHSLGYVADSKEQAVQEYFPGYSETFTRIGKERGWPPVTKERFYLQNDSLGALLVGDPDSIAEKIIKHSNALGGISRFTFQMDNAGLSHKKLLKSIELIANKVKPIVEKYFNKDNS